MHTSYIICRAYTQSIHALFFFVSRIADISDVSDDKDATGHLFAREERYGDMGEAFELTRNTRLLDSSDGELPVYQSRLGYDLERCLDECLHRLSQVWVMFLSVFTGIVKERWSWDRYRTEIIAIIPDLFIYLFIILAWIRKVLAKSCCLTNWVLASKKKGGGKQWWNITAL